MVLDDPFDSAPCGLALLDGDGLFLRANRRLRQWLEEGDVAAAGGRLSDYLDGGDAEFGLLRATLRQCGALNGFRLSLRRKNGARLPIDANFSLCPGDDRIHVAAFRRAPAEQSAAIVACSIDAIVSVDPLGRALDVNPAFCALFGFSDAEIIGADLGALIAPMGEREKFRRKLENAVAGAIKGHYVRRRRKDGALIDLTLSTAPSFGAHGEIASVAFIYRNIEPLTRAAEQIEFLLREVHHRSKNFLAVAQAIARQSAKAEPEPKIFAENFSARLAALAAIHNLVLARGGRGVCAQALAESLLATLPEHRRARVTVAAGGLAFNGRAAETIGLVLSELIDIFLRGEAAGEADATVELGFRLDEAEKNFTMSWRARGMSAETKPSGFGEKILTQLAPLALGGAARLDFFAQGFCYEFCAPVDEAVMR